MPMYREFTAEVEARMLTEENFADILSMTGGREFCLYFEDEQAVDGSNFNSHHGILFADGSLVFLDDYVIDYGEGIFAGMNADAFNENFQEVL